MIRGLFLAGALSAFFATAASAEVVFVGTISITKVTAQCANVHVGEHHNSTFHPFRPFNAGFSALSLVDDHSARGHQLDGAAFDATLRTVKTGGVGWGNLYTSQTPSQIAVTSYAPLLSKITAKTLSLTIKGKIARLYDDPGGLACVATFIASYVKDQNQ